MHRKKGKEWNIILTFHSTPLRGGLVLSLRLIGRVGARRQIYGLVIYLFFMKKNEKQEHSEQSTGNWRAVNA